MADEVRLVPMGDDSLADLGVAADMLAELARTIPDVTCGTLPERLRALADAYENGITEEEARALDQAASGTSWLAAQATLDEKGRMTNREEHPILAKLRAAFTTSSTKEGDGDG